MESASRADRIGLAIRRPADARPLRPRVCRACMACRLWRRAAERIWVVFPLVQSVVLAGRPYTTSEWCRHSAGTCLFCAASGQSTLNLAGAKLGCKLVVSETCIDCVRPAGRRPT